jgi:hypothetical protein
MAERLKLDVDDLERATTDIRKALGILSGEAFFSKEIAGLVGHGALAQKVLDFEKTWNDRREEIVGAVTKLNSALAAIGTGFATLEDDLQGAFGGADDSRAARGGGGSW